MKINAVISSDIIKKNRSSNSEILLFTFFTLAFAIVTGTVLYIAFEERLFKDIAQNFSVFTSEFSKKSAFEIFSGTIINHLYYIFFIIIMGTSSFGFVFILLLSFIRVSGLGLINAYLYSVFGLKGIEYTLLVFSPGKFVFILSVMLIMNFSLNNSLNLSKLLKGEAFKDKADTNYSVKMVVAVALFVFSSLIDCFFAVNFSSLFSF